MKPSKVEIRKLTELTEAYAGLAASIERCTEALCKFQAAELRLEKPSKACHPRFSAANLLHAAEVMQGDI